MAKTQFTPTTQTDELTPLEVIATLKDVAERLKGKALAQCDAELTLIAERIDAALKASLTAIAG